MSSNLVSAPINVSDMENLEKEAVDPRSSPGSYDEKIAAKIGNDEVQIAEGDEHKSAFHMRFRPYILATTTLVILGWWISATVLEATRCRWIVQTLFAWLLILVILFRFVPTTIISRRVEAVWDPLVQRPFLSLTYRTRLAIGWLFLIAIVLGSAYGFPLTNVSYAHILSSGQNR
jgi:CNT family concentrative nucleoside transporter